MNELFEAIMVLCFGASWPVNAYKSYRSRTAKGKSLAFECLILIGYIFGIAGKILSHNITYVFAFYILNLVMVTIDICFYIRNVRLDKLTERA